ncbi:pentapeptide repeat-containing protein [Leptolyngbya sp. FACHB-17]|nr:pentapeptide repeat-containing protein [Leptolyngbya sp. FACHB-17]MBD2079282.1 pentapeptide repeat-containing protein [Leptolyngbya sp. FACHB-17]
MSQRNFPQLSNITDLSGADLSRANLRGAYLFNANLSGADLSEANLNGAGLDGVIVESTFW